MHLANNNAILHTIYTHPHQHFTNIVYKNKYVVETAKKLVSSPYMQINIKLLD